ncbi:hypothetical protein PIB30_023831 [Stylosanthes scabra]|uniref:Putative plant transposon protein domain-containing protein n=1 Tax=Stylosanthes scabra TaxID=79078 RepID=A0ABU6Q9B1_9FABA|nr:hypothetical protein [Stylosanthes scabra]
MAKGWYDFVCRSILLTTNRSELTVERAVLIHSIIIGENINMEEIIAYQFYKFVYKTELSSSLPFPSIIAALCLDAKVTTLKGDTLINQEVPIVGEAMIRTRETRPRNPREARQEAPPQQQQPPQVQPQPQVQQQEFPSNFYTHFDASMSQIYRRLDSQQEESRKSFEAINSRMDRMDDQLSFLCYSNQMVNETMYFPYQNTARQFKEMEMQGIPVTIANLAIHRHREEEMNQEKMRHNQMVQEATSQQARETNKGKARKVVPDSEEEEDSEELASSAFEECTIHRCLPDAITFLFGTPIDVPFPATRSLSSPFQFYTPCKVMVDRELRVGVTNWSHGCGMYVLGYSMARRKSCVSIELGIHIWI